MGPAGGPVRLGPRKPVATGPGCALAARARHPADIEVRASYLPSERTAARASEPGRALRKCRPSADLASHECDGPRFAAIMDLLGAININFTYCVRACRFLSLIVHRAAMSTNMTSTELDQAMARTSQMWPT